MALPYGEFAYVPRSKLTDYLLDPDHPEGHSKAEYLARLGLGRSDWPILRASLLDCARRAPAREVKRTVYGRKFLVSCRIAGPRGTGRLLTLWMLPRDGRPRLITAYPTRSR